ncbi:uncharacterized protein LOC120314275 isoform X2 [Crotalus tigris]|uniref:uncharacterized protein LOC120314275 isoform X2 n=1 Tax=Crotalus tigris TaxID=88082 RepID=UPI00192F9005|nr:uncharacterized protein LOC120314275 isoform X2 [Crotalus tigris]
MEYTSSIRRLQNLTPTAKYTPDHRRFHPDPPNVSKMGEVRNTGVENARLKVQQSREALKATREEYQRSFENFKKQNEELTEILCTMRRYQVKEVDFDTARKMLIKGLEALSRVKEQWEKMVRFFQMISNLIETSLVWSVKEFADTVDSAQKVSSYSSKAFMADLVYGHIFNASSVAQLVAMISEAYTMVSEKYLMERVSSLGHLLAMEAEELNPVTWREEQGRSGNITHPPLKIGSL